MFDSPRAFLVVPPVAILMSLKPRTVGVLGVIAGLGVCVGGGALIAQPSIWFLGVIVLIAGTLLFSVAATWIVRKSWSRTDWPDTSIPEAKGRRRVRCLFTFRGALAPIMIGGSVWLIIDGSAGPGGFLLVWGIIQLGISIWVLRVLAKRQPLDPPTKL